MNKIEINNMKNEWTFIFIFIFFANKRLIYGNRYLRFLVINTRSHKININ